MLIDARKNQMNQKEHYLAVQAQRERNEFERVLRYEKYQWNIIRFIDNKMETSLCIHVFLGNNCFLS